MAFHTCWLKYNLIPGSNYYSLLQMETDSWLEDAANGLMGSQVNLLFVLILVYFYVDIF